MKFNSKNIPSYIFVDTSLAIDLLKINKIYDDSTIITSSPYMRRLEPDVINPFESSIHKSQISDLIESGFNFSKNIFDSLSDSSFSDYALLAALQAHNLQKWVRKSIPFTDNHFTDSVLVIQIVDNQNNVISAYDNKINELLSGNPNLQIIPINIEDIIDGRFQISHLDLFRELKKRAFAKFNRIRNKIPSVKRDLESISNGIIANYPSRNHLLVDLAVGLRQKGYKIEHLVRYEVNKSDYNDNKYKDVFEHISPILNEHLSQFVSSKLIGPLSEIYYQNTFYAFDEYDRQLLNWEMQIDKITPKAVMSSFPARPDMIALSKVCSIRNIPYISAQHGFGREVDKLHRVSIATYENSVADLVLTYNNTSAKILNENNPFKKGKAISVGFPSYVLDRLNSTNQNIWNIKVPEIIYVSNMLFMGNTQMIHVGTASDEMKSEFDINLLSVFKEVNKKVLFKLYPTTHINVDTPTNKYKLKRIAPNRYLDLNPISKLVETSKNITFHEGNQDALDMFKKHKIIVLAGCSTSLGNALMSGVPLVYINNSQIRPMQEEILNEFSDTVFCFDSEDGQFNNDLRDFLNLNIDQMQKLWNEKSAKRNQFIDKYIDSSKSNYSFDNAVDKVSNFINTF
ncbi:MAG: hypothetical protein ACJ0BE_01565 [Dehalococcoidia bacterium]